LSVLADVHQVTKRFTPPEVAHVEGTVAAILLPLLPAASVVPAVFVTVTELAQCISRVSWARPVRACS
jgi:uncharacterized membrane protein (DUF4010 family)